MKNRLKSLLEDITTKKGKFFGIFIQVLIIISIITFSLDTQPNLSAETKEILKFIELFCIVIFSLEYLLRIYVADSKAKFIFSFFGIIDFLAILPFYLSIGIDLRSIRSLRLLRLFRLFKLVRYNNAIQKFVVALRYAKEELVLFFFITIILLYLSAVGIYYFENTAQPDAFSSIFDSLWWAVATLTTVGYGDVYPITMGGKIFTFFILLIGLSVIAIPAGIISSALSNSIKKNH
tara:strand:- start:31 stop:735 length:705 start_codon:yes stop_codon:yes gene_type:complete